ncbi:MAG: hypothetical protein J7L88_01665 [Thermoplasmata archaeon]|nr:hypothetical protein [Thermoplasmata archaeon]
MMESSGRVYLSTISKTPVLLLGPYSPEGDYEILKQLLECLRENGAESTKLCEELGDSFDMESISRKCLSWAEIVIVLFTNTATRGGTTVEATLLFREYPKKIENTLFLTELGDNDIPAMSEIFLEEAEKRNLKLKMYKWERGREDLLDVLCETSFNFIQERVMSFL